MEEEKKETLEEKEKPDNMKKSFKEKLAKKDLEIEALKAERDKWKNDYYRVFADTQNLRKEIERDFSTAMKYRAEGFLDKLLPTLDGFYMALKNEPEDQSLKNYLVGFKYIYSGFVSALESEGASQISPKVGDIFDPNTMNAIDTEESDEKEGVVLKVCNTGMMLKDRLIRPASVIVSKKRVEKQDNNDSEKESE